MLISRVFAFGESLRLRTWIKVNEPVVRWVQLEYARRRLSSMICNTRICRTFASRLVWLAMLMYCPNLVERDADGWLPCKESIKWPGTRKSWGSGPQMNQGSPNRARYKKDD